MPKGVHATLKLEADDVQVFLLYHSTCPAVCMLKYRIPRNVGVHRIAAIGLFRALLSQCRKLPFDATDKTLLANIVRHRFKGLAYEQSQWRLKTAWEAGYTGLHLLDKSAGGDDSSTEKIRSLLARAPSRLTESPKPHAPPTSIKRACRKLDVQDSILARPRLVISGKRRIPVLTFGNRIPFLRIKKPQPHALGALLRKRERVQLSRTRRLEAYEQTKKIGIFEDQWDKLLQQQGVGQASDARKTTNDGASWKDAYVDAMKIIIAQQEQWLQKRIDHGLKLLRVVEEEKALAAEEAAQRRHERYQAFLARQDVKPLGSKQDMPERSQNKNAK